MPSFIIFMHLRPGIQEVQIKQVDAKNTMQELNAIIF